MADSRIVFGFPDFSPRVAEAFPKFFQVVDRAASSLDGILTRAYPELDPVQNVLLNLGILAANGVTELITLAGNGFGPGAMKIARTVLETTINAEYLRLFPDECDDYLDWHWVEQYKLLAYMRENMPSRASELPQIAGTEAEFNRVRSRFQRPNGELRGGWCRLDLGARAAKTGFQGPYKLIQPLASRLIHGTIGGLAMHRNAADDTVRIGVPPSLNFCKEALLEGHACLLRIIGTLSKSLRAEPNPALEELVSDYRYSWGNPPSEA